MKQEGPAARLESPGFSRGEEVKGMVRVAAPMGWQQTIRAVHAVAEAGIDVGVKPDDMPLFAHLADYFNINRVVSVAQWHTLLAADVTVDHKPPTVTVGDTMVPMLYPRQVLEYCRRLWSTRAVSVFWAGAPSPRRETQLAGWRTMPGVRIVESRGGRTAPGKAWDDYYYRTLATSRFGLCTEGTDTQPNGDYAWTYRFFDAVLCGAIPVVCWPVPCYNGFTWYTPDQWREAVYDPDVAEANWQLALQRWTLPADTIREAAGV